MVSLSLLRQKILVQDIQNIDGSTLANRCDTELAENSAPVPLYRTETSIARGEIVLSQ